MFVVYDIVGRYRSYLGQSWSGYGIICSVVVSQPDFSYNEGELEHENDEVEA